MLKSRCHRAMCSSLEALGEEPVSCPFKIVGRIQTLFICAVPDVYRMTLWKPLPSFVFLFPLPFISVYPYRNRMTYFLLYSFNKIMHVQNWAGLWGSLPHTPFHGGELVGFGWRNSPAVAWLFVGKLGLAVCWEVRTFLPGTGLHSRTLSCQNQTKHCP